VDANDTLTITAVSSAAGLVTASVSGKINAGVANSMIVKVVNSLKSYDNGNITTAGNQLNALKDEIKAKVKPGGLTEADATLAISLIDALYDSMTP
jgi:predicted ABC-type transport system involved in lysophospholipase L1 biosynthesis ATPase subunit